MPNRLITTIILIIILIGAGACFTSRAPSINAANNDFILTWSANSYIPPSYEGRALPSRGSKIEVFALPVKKLAQNPDYLYYRWLLDDDVVGWANGIGKQSFKFMAEKWAGDFHKIESQILDSQQRVILSQGSIYIKIVNPDILISDPNNDYYSITEKIATRTGKKIKLTARPFFFNISKIADLNFNWRFEDQELFGPNEESNPNLLFLTIPKGNLNKTLYKNLYLSASPKSNSGEQASINLSVEIK